MGWLRGRIIVLLEQPRPCCMIRDYICSCGQKHATLQYSCKIGVHTGFLDELHQRRLSQARSLMFHISVSLAQKFISMCPKIAGRSWSPQQRRVFS